VSLLLKVACPDCGQHTDATLAQEVRCGKCGRDFRAQADDEGRTRVISASSDDLDNVPYSQRVTEIPVNKVSSVIVADPALHNDKLLRDIPLKENNKWLGKVCLLKKLGQGGMGAVYKGYDDSLALDVAVKILPLSMGERNSQFVERFRQEARISARINHPNVVRTLHVDEQGDLLYLVMDYVAGQTARSLVESKGPLSLPQALQIAQDAARGMQAAHEHGVIHRDIKPDNILVADDGRVLLSDLGLAKAASGGTAASHMPVTRIGLLLGTPEYMSPEQWEIGAQIGPASDIWSLGATLWMLLTGKPPYDEKDLAVLSRRVKESPLPDILLLRPGLPDHARYILLRCLAKKTSERFANSAELLSAIDDALAALSSPQDSLPLPKVIALQRARAAEEMAEAQAEAAEHTQRAQTALSNQDIDALKPPPKNPVLPPRRKPSLAKRLAWVGVPAATALLGGFAAMRYFSPSVDTGALSAAAVALDLRCPPRVKPGAEAELSATVNSNRDPAEYDILWTTGGKTLTGNTVRLALQQDTQFDVTVVEKNTGREVLRKSVTIAVDLEVRAAAAKLLKLETGDTLTLEGLVAGGPGLGGLDTRWLKEGDDAQPLSSNTLLKRDDLPVGRHVFVLQARLKSQAGWEQAVSDKVVVEVSLRVPPAYKAALAQALLERDAALRADSGAAAVEHWRKLLAHLETALNEFPTGTGAAEQLEQCLKLRQPDLRYANLFSETLRLRQVAEALPASDPLRLLSAWSDAQRPCAAALALFDRAEARAQSEFIDGKVAELRHALADAEQARDTFETSITQARRSMKEARKYVSPAYALPHWEDALAGFNALAKQHPKRAEEFALELNEARENRDKAYLHENFGVIPAQPGEESDNPPVKKKGTPAPADDKPQFQKPPARIPDPSRPVKPPK
jgi:serine/threonine-protein kinase